MSKKKKLEKTPTLAPKVDLNFLCDLIVLTDAYRSGHRLDYTKLRDAIREGKLGKSFHQKEWPQIREVILQADEARASLAEWKDEKSDKIRTRRRIALSIGYIFLPLGVGLSVIPIIFGIPVDFSFALIALFIGAGFLIAGYVYYRIRLSEHIDAIYATEFEAGVRASKKLKSLTQELINTFRSALKNRVEQGVYTEIRDVELELYNIDYEHIRYRGVTSRAKRLKKVYIEVE